MKPADARPSAPQARFILVTLLSPLGLLLLIALSRLVWRGRGPRKPKW